MPEITYRPLGASALKVSPLCLGAMMFGGVTDEPTSRRIVSRAWDARINFIDTADVYNDGASEEVVGRAIAPHRDDWVVATKFGYGGGSGPNRGGQSAKWIMRAVEGSLRRLHTDYLDILYFHRPAPDQPFEEGLRTIGNLIRAGKVRYYGVSNFKGLQIVELCRLADALGIPRPVISQPLYNISDRGAEVEQIPAASHCGLGVVPYSPLARGVLSGKYTPDTAPPEGSRAARGDRRMQQTEWRAESLYLAQAVAERAATLGISSIDYSIGWVLRNRAVSAAIAGPRTEDQWEAYLKAMTVTLPDEEETFVDGLVRPGHASTPGYTDPSYPVAGRMV